MPPSLLSGFPNGSAPSLSRFLSRTLETAPDGESRRWPTNDPSVSLIVRADATEIADDTLCRRATIILDRPRGERRIAYRACRTATGMWQPSEGPGRRLAGPELISAP